MTDRQITHGHDCWGWGPKHYECAVAEIERLRAEVREAREFRDKLAKAIGNEQLRMFIEKHGEPVPLTIRMQEAEARAERLEEALRKLEEREQRDEALLRQALEALERGAWDTLSGRNAAFAIRERLGLEQEE